MKLPELYQAEADGPRCLTHWNADALKDIYVAQPRPLTAELDGEEIDGWVLLPEDYDPEKKYPAVLDIHGGHKCAYGPVFFHEMQAWAAKGYIVFFCNPHGSDGRGNAFAYLDLQWGSIDYRQIMAFTDKVLETYPAIDTSRLCCTGGSYGGYMSNWILGHTDRFCCIATQRSISNWVTMYGVSDIPPLFSGETCDTDPYSEKGIKEMWDVSPLKYVNNAKILLGDKAYSKIIENIAKVRIKDNAMAVAEPEVNYGSNNDSLKIKAMQTIMKIDDNKALCDINSYLDSFSR